MPTDDEENTDGTNKGGDLQLVNKLQTLSRGTERMPQVEQSQESCCTLINTSSMRANERKNLATYDTVPQSRIINCLKMHKISDEVINFIEKTMETWRMELTAEGRSWVEAKIQRDIFQGDAQSPLLFVIAMMPLSYLLRKYTGGYKLSKSQEKINPLMYKDNIEWFAKNEKELKTLIQAVMIYSQHIGMEFSIENKESGKQYMTEGIEPSNQDKIRTLREKETYRYLGILEADTSKQVETKGKIFKKYLRRMRKLLEAKLNRRNLIKGIHIWAIPLVRYSGHFLKWTREQEN